VALQNYKKDIAEDN